MNNEQAIYNVPVNSRIFVLFDKNYPISKNEFDKMFGIYGTITNIYIVKNQYGKDDVDSTKGVAYIKYSKASEAFKAIEAMDGYRIEASNQCIKVLMASSHGQNQQYSEIEYNRLFVIIPKSDTELDLANTFSKYGEIAKIHIVKKKDTSKSKGIAFITYKKPSSAALAIEQLEKSIYRAAIAKPRQEKLQVHSNKRKIDSRDSMSSNDMVAPVAYQYPHRNKSAVLTAYTPLSLTRNDLFKILNIAPELELVTELPRQQVYDKKIFQVVYRTVTAAEYAVNRINGFEYPPGLPITLEFYNYSQSASSAINHGVVKNISNDIQVFSNTVTNALAVIKNATTTATLGMSNDYSTPLVPRLIHDSQLFPVPENTIKLFFVCKPNIPPMDKLEDAFKMFEGLIDMYVIDGMNYGFVTYDSVASATRAINCLNDKKICNSNMKIMKAKPREPKSKRIRLDTE